MTESHFAWTWTFSNVPMTSQTGETYIFNNFIMRSAGGTYTFDGETHTETITHGTADQMNFINRQAVVRVRFEGNNRFYTTGVLAGVIPLNEVWERIE